MASDGLQSLITVPPGLAPVLGDLRSVKAVDRGMANPFRRGQTGPV